MRTKRWIAAVGLGVVWLVVACDGELSEAPADTRAVGVQPDNREASAEQGGASSVPDPGPMWIVADTPIVSFNGEGAESTGDFFQIAGGLRLGDGRIVVADQARVRVFDSAGQFLNGFGGRGDGPAEWRGVAWIKNLPGDSLLVGHLRTNRLAVFALDGTLGRTVRLAGSARSFGAFADGTVIGGTSSTGALVESSVVRGSLDLVRYDAVGRIMDSLGHWPEDESFIVEVCFLERCGPTALQLLGLHRTLVAVGPQEVYVSTGERLEVSVLGATGDTLRVLQAPYELTPLSGEELIQGNINIGLSRLMDESLAAASLASWPADRTRSVVEVLKVDDVGNVWAMEYPDDPSARRRWVVLGPEGRRIANVETPERFYPLHIGDDFVLGTWTDALDVQYVQLRSLTKPAVP